MVDEMNEILVILKTCHMFTYKSKSVLFTRGVIRSIKSLKSPIMCEKEIIAWVN